MVKKRVKSLFLLPTTIIFLAFGIYPLIYVVYMSFYTWVLGAEFTLSIPWNYVRTLSDARFIGALSRTLLFVSVSVPVEVLLGLVFANLISGVKRSRRLLVGIFILPLLATPVAISYMWRMILDVGYGPINLVLEMLGLPKISFVTDPRIVMFTISLVDIWQWTPFAFIVFYAAIQSLPVEPFEAALIDGASGWMVFRRLTLPKLKPIIMVVALLRLVEAFKVFDYVYIITGGGPGYASETLSHYIFTIFFRFLDFGYASALTMLYFIIMIALFTLLLTYLVKMRGGS